MNQADVKVSFYLKKSEADAKGNCPVMARLNVGKYSEAAFSVKMSVPHTMWHSGRATGKSVAAREINRQLDEIRASALHTQVKNTSNVPYEVDFITFKIVDKQVMKRTAIQEQVIFPLRAYDYATTVAGNKDERTVFVFDKFTIPADKVLVVEMHEKSGGRHQTFTVESDDIVRAKVINELKVK